MPQPIVHQNLWGANGNVISLARSGNTLYMAGAFRSVGENCGGLVALDDGAGQVRRILPKVAGSVAVITPDGAGGWYIGGDFTAVAGLPRSCVARLNADGSLSDWNPGVSGSPGYVTPPSVAAIALVGGHVFIGGAFRAIGGQAHENLGCVDAQTAAVVEWNLDTNIDEPVSAFAVHSDTLFVGGSFSSVGGVPRSSLAAISVATGSVLSWQVDLYGGASALLASGDTLYVGGTFSEIGGWGSSKLAAASISGSAAIPIDFRVRGVYQQYLPPIQVDALAKAGDTLYAVGNFTGIGGQVRSGIAAVDARTGDALAWLPDSAGPRRDGDPPPLCKTVAVSGTALYVGGYFGLVNDEYHPLVAAWDRQSGHVLAWNPMPDDVVLALATRGDTIYAGGDFHMIGPWQHRAGLAALDVTSGRLKTWNPNPNGVICTAVAVRGDRVLVSGDFSVIGGDPQPRSYFAALDTTNGEVIDWDPGANDLATTFLLCGDTLYAGGMFTEIGGQTRYGAAALDAMTGQVLPWDPSANSIVYALARNGATVFLGGTFTEMGGQPRLGLAAVDAISGALNSWDPGTDNSTVNALQIAGGVVYVGGGFHALGGQARNAIGAVDATSGAVLQWYPPPTAWGVPSNVEALTLLDGLVYVGGEFGSMNGQSRICLAAVDTATSVVTSWDPGLDGYVWSLLHDGNTIYVGGGFSRAGGLPAHGLAAFSLPALPPAPPRSLILAQCTPNPAHESATIHFGLPSAQIVTLSVFDLQGRRVAVPLLRQALSAGQHNVQVRTQNWRPGCYSYRLEAGGIRASRKMVVVN